MGISSNVPRFYSYKQGESNKHNLKFVMAKNNLHSRLLGGGDSGGAEGAGPS